MAHTVLGTATGGVVGCFFVSGDAVASLVLGAVTLLVLVRDRTIPAVRTLPLAGRFIPLVRLAAAAAISAGILQFVNGAPVLGLVVGTLVASVTWRLTRAAHPHRTRVLVMGTLVEAAALERSLREVRAEGFCVVGASDDLDLVDAAIARTSATLVVISDSVPRETALSVLLDPTRDVALMDLTHFCELALGIVPLSGVDDEWLMELRHPQRYARADRARRLLDIAVALVALPFVLLLVVICAPLILLDGEGRVLFRQQRVGKFGQPFDILKLRTMRGTGHDWSHADDPRVTPIGAFLRATHLDEAPQILNVLKGDMAMVGPRPEQVGITEWLTDEIPHFAHRLTVAPGVTGWSRVRSGYAASTRASAIKLSNDLFYIRHRSIALDLAVILETARTALFERQYDVAPPAADIAVDGLPTHSSPARRPPPVTRPDVPPAIAA